MKSRLTSLAPLLLLVLCLPQLNCGQTGGPTPPAGKTEALRAVKVSSAEGWKETVSDAGHFRVLFPGDPEPGDSTGGPNEMLWFKLSEGDATWTAIYTNFPESTSDDPAQIREAFRQSVEVMSRKGKKLLRQMDVTLNGKPGTEFVLEGRGELTFIRSFLAGRRMYVLEVDYKRGPGGDSTLPKDVEKFFDSFTFWD